MERICFMLKIRPDRIAEYKRRHDEVWPEMRQALQETGWGNYSLFLSDDGTLVGYLETDDFNAAQRGMAARDVNARWQAEMSEFFADLDDQRPDDAMRPLPEVFHLD